MSSAGFLQFFWLVAFFNSSPVLLYPVESDDYIMRRGWYNDAAVWYVPFAASNVNLARQLDYYVDQSHEWPVNPVMWAFRLGCFLEGEVPGDVYFLNCAQTTVFSTEPGLPDYNPIWEAHYLEWVEGMEQIPLTNEADVLAAIALGDLAEVLPPSILDATIIFDSTRQQTVALAEVDWSEREVEFYAFPVHYANKVGKQREIRYIVITDTNSLDAAEVLGANYAPTLGDVDEECCDAVLAFVTPVPATCQLPIIRNKPEPRSFDYLNLNRDYTPIRSWTLLERTGLPDYVTVNNQLFMTKLYVEGLVDIVNPHPPLLPELIVTNSPDSFAEEDNMAQ